MEQQKTIQSTARRTFLWMPKLDFYVVREFMIPFSVLIFAFSLLFLIGDVFNDVDKFIEKENATAAAIRYFMLKMPGNLLFVMPITVLLVHIGKYGAASGNHSYAGVRNFALPLQCADLCDRISGDAVEFLVQRSDRSEVYHGNCPDHAIYRRRR